MEQIELIETVIENEKSRGETSKIGNPLPREKIRPIETGRAGIAKVYILKEIFIKLARFIISIIVAGAILCGSIKDIDLPTPEPTPHPFGEASPVEPPPFLKAPPETSSPSFTKFHPATSSPSLDLPSEKLIEALTKILEKTP